MASVHYRGIDDVIDAYELRGLPNWAIADGRQFMQSYVGDNISDAGAMLEAYLEKLSGSGTKATYTLRVYNPAAIKDGYITDKTPYIGSFNFRFLKETDEGYGMQGTHPNSLTQRLAGIEEKLAKGNKGDEDNGIIGQVADYVENNEWAQDIIKNLAGKFLGMTFDQGRLAIPERTQALAGVGDDDTIIKQAIDILKKRTTNLGARLMKIANMDDATLSYILSMLDKV